MMCNIVRLSLMLFKRESMFCFMHQGVRDDKKQKKNEGCKQMKKLEKARKMRQIIRFLKNYENINKKINNN